LDDSWPFDDPQDVAVITLKRIIFEGRPILYVSHDEEDGYWQFLDGRDVASEDAAVVGLGEVVERDPSILELADLPGGWKAWRSSPDAEWQRSPSK
jgi:hypothetical protein